MHSANGNGSLLFLLLGAVLALCSAMTGACAESCDLKFAINVICCILSLQCIKALLSQKRKKHSCVHRCRFVGRCRTKGVHRQFSTKKCRWLIAVLCVSSPFTFLCINAVVQATPMPVLMKPEAAVSCVSRKRRNRLAHSLNGNTVLSRTKWETTQEEQGIQLYAPEELQLPGDAAPQALPAYQVKNGAIGYSYCNQVALTPKLKVKGGSYLLLIVPGSMGSDLRQQLNDASPTLIGGCFEMVLTCIDPRTRKVFPRNVVGINLGIQHVKPAELKPQVNLETDQSREICVSCFAKHNPEGYAEISGRTPNETKYNIVSKLLHMTKLQTIDIWGLKNDLEKRKVTCFARVPADKAVVLFDCCDPVLFFRPFISRTNPPVAENGIALLWANKIRDANQLVTVTNTLKGIRGFVANDQSLGVRVETSGIAAARAAIQHDRPQVVSSNRHIAGSLHYIARGFPVELSASTITHVLHRRLMTVLGSHGM